MSTQDSYPGAYRGRRVLVTGATGFIGRWVARGLAAAGADLWVTGRDGRSLREVCDAYEIQAWMHVADLSESGAFGRLFQEVRPDVTFNLAGYGVDSAERGDSSAAAINVRLAQEAAETIAGASPTDWPGVRLVHVGSAAEYGPVPEILTEESKAQPTNLYGKTKLEGTRRIEAVIGRTGLRALTVRLFTVYGPGEHPHRLLPALLAAAQTGATLRLTAGQQRRDFTYVEDVSEGLLRAGCVEGPAPAILNLATGTLTSVREFVECAAEQLGLRAGQLQFGALPYRADEPQQGAADTQRMERLLAWRPACSIREGLRRTMAFPARLSGARA
jgi:UDP-glucose 4-epimerase